MSEANRLLAESQQWYENQARRKERERQQAEFFPFLVRLVSHMPFVVGLVACLIWFF